jgi:hypothetical protein
MQNKQTSVKPQENAVSPEANFQRWKQQKFYVNIVMFIDSKAE